MKEMICRFKEARPTSRDSRKALMRMGRAPTKMWWEKEALKSASFKDSTEKSMIVSRVLCCRLTIIVKHHQTKHIF
jgi:hypothetical protein